ncbi:hypothetical protein C8Q76DRAFT_292191 [Earliella scabrosa]|nr:hypothetical protein C8Q76DRAFT_292191 [Earliella scabrosa]
MGHSGHCVRTRLAFPRPFVRIRIRGTPPVGISLRSIVPVAVRASGAKGLPCAESDSRRTYAYTYTGHSHTHSLRPSPCTCASPSHSAQRLKSALRRTLRSRVKEIERQKEGARKRRKKRVAIGGSISNRLNWYVLA